MDRVRRFAEDRAGKLHQLGDAARDLFADFDAAQELLVKLGGKSLGRTLKPVACVHLLANTLASPLEFVLVWEVFDLFDVIEGCPLQAPQVLRVFV